MNVGFSRWLAVAFGVLLPLLGIVRNWTDEQRDAPAFFANLAAGTFLLFAAWKVGHKERVGRRYLAAAWGIACGMFYASLATQLRTIGSPEQANLTIGSEWAAGATGVGLLVAVVGLISSLGSTQKH